MGLDRRDQRNLCRHPDLGLAANDRAALLFSANALPELDAHVVGTDRQCDVLGGLHNAGRRGAAETQRYRSELEIVGSPRRQSASFRCVGKYNAASGARERAKFARRVGPALRSPRKTDRLLAETYPGALPKQRAELHGFDRHPRQPANPAPGPRASANGRDAVANQPN